MSSADPFVPPQSIAEWATRIRLLADELRSLSSEEFFDPSSHNYHNCMRHFGRLLHSVSLDPEIDQNADAFGNFVRAYPQTNGWLPQNSAELSRMELSEVLYRIWRNNSDGRWVSGALVSAFKCGSLVAALDRLAGEADRLPIVIR